MCLGLVQAEPASSPTGTAAQAPTLLSTCTLVRGAWGVADSCLLPYRGPWSGKVLPNPEDVFEA